jgi:hypothetical protein
MHVMRLTVFQPLTQFEVSAAFGLQVDNDAASSMDAVNQKNKLGDVETRLS